MLGNFLFDTLLGPIIVAVLIIAAMKEILKLTTTMSGTFGKIGSDLASTALGVAAGAATGGVASLARGTVGAYAASKLASGELKEGSKLHSLATSATKASFDVRNLAGDKSVLGKTVGGLISKGGGSLGVGVGKGGGIGGVEKQAKDRQKEATDNIPKMSIFEEQGARDRAEKDAGKRKEEASRNTASATFNARSAGENLAEKQKNVTSAQKLHEESDIAKEVERTKATYEESLTGPVDMNAKKAHNDAVASHSTSGTPIALQEALKEMRKAKEADEEAKKNVQNAESAESYDAKKESEKEIKAENERRRNAYADKVAKGGDRITADKIRKGDESGHEKKAKEFATELKKEKEGKARPEVIEHIEEKIEEHKGNK